MKETKEIKCVVWDLDNTLWNGTLLEDDDVSLKDNITTVIKELDNRGILQSIASKNNFSDALNVLKRFNLDKYFLYPEIHWNAKSSSIQNIRENLNIGIDTIMFIDDMEFELDEVKSICPEVECVNAAKYGSLLSLPRLNPKFITEDSRRRRLMYIDDIKRNREEEKYVGPKEEFLASLNMQFKIDFAEEKDLQRAEELTVRTNQLNAIGKTYSYNELNQLRTSKNHMLLVCELIDRYSSYGKIGLALVEKDETKWHLRMFLMSCRVISRGVGTVLLSYILQEAKNNNKKLFADFKPNPRNKMMYLAYKFAGFREIKTESDNSILLETDFSAIQKFPRYIKVVRPQK